MGERVTAGNMTRTTGVAVVVSDVDMYVEKLNIQKFVPFEVRSSHI